MIDKTKNNHGWLPLILLLLLGIIWGTGYSIARYATTNGVNPLGYSFWQSIGPAILIGSLAFFMRTKKYQLSAKNFRYYFICALTGIVLPNTNMYYAAAHLPAGILAVIVNTVPIMAYVMAVLARLESFSWIRFIAVGLSICGLMLIIVPSSHLANMPFTPWLLSALFTPLCFAFCAVYISRHSPPSNHILTLATGTLIISALLLTPLVLVTKNFYAFHLPLTRPDWVILLEIILSSAGYLLFYKLIKIAGAVYYSFVETIVAITGLFWGYIIFAERLNIWTAPAVTLILISLILVSKRQRGVVE
jgi:drug/metabolite transporter (DMT)-like permease